MIAPERFWLVKRGKWQGIRTHGLAALVFLAFWIVTWLVTAITWELDAEGHSVGMNSIAIPLHFVLPFVVGGLIGLFRNSTMGSFWKTCALAGLVFGVIHFLVLLVVDVLWLPQVESGVGFSELAAEALAFALSYAVICVVLSMVGGWVSRTFFSSLVRQ